MDSENKHLKVKQKSNGVWIIEYNRPQVYNALNFEIMLHFATVLKAANSDDSCKIVAFTGNGKYFTSGNDQKNIMDPKLAEIGQVSPFVKFVQALIDMKKPVIALVNGPAIGAGVTTLALCDVVVCSDRATFSTPFTRIGAGPEACSTITFPVIMGRSKASEMLMFNKKATAQEMLECGLVSQVIPHEKFAEVTSKMLDDYSQLGLETLMRAKRMMWPEDYRKKLHEVATAEMEEVSAAMRSEEAMSFMMKFIERSQARKSKL